VRGLEALQEVGQEAPRKPPMPSGRGDNPRRWAWN